ncbi:winged helix domain-containing protein [Devosia psychrophila]|uniref:Winged helix domain-containing protein n=1 Tax=Devosia psychrophila TaxID=728005 RepID=A0A1I1NSJ3_9HYPH|nr:hypothetical protein [Devosia psychrophila]SFD00589.1 hypothetical protein SAMN04488059_11738 [Devosia psychrophila]
MTKSLKPNCDCIVRRGGEVIGTIKLSGRVLWALLSLMREGERGCTPITRPAPRWSHYIHQLRTVYNINVETINEGHEGVFSGTHARYVLRDQTSLFGGNLTEYLMSPDGRREFPNANFLGAH